jgi:hypothetical protein
LIAGDLIRQAQESGVELRLLGGKVKAIGPRDVLARLIEPLRQHRDALAHALQFEMQEALPATPEVELVDWHALHAAYLAHHVHCPLCIAAGRGSRYGQRCGTGLALWREYSS